MSAGSDELVRSALFVLVDNGAWTLWPTSCASCTRPTAARAASSSSS